MPRSPRKRIITYVEQLPGGQTTRYCVEIQGELKGQAADVKAQLAEARKDTPPAKLPGAALLRIFTRRSAPNKNEQES